MEASAISSVAALSGSQARPAIERMKSEDFFRLLVAELQQQDPFEPAKTADMIGQISQIRDIELSTQLTSTLEQLTRQQRTAGASELLGKFVEAAALGPDGLPTMLSGVVTGVRFSADGTAVLELDTGETVRATDVLRVTTVDAAEQGADRLEPLEASPTKSDATARSRQPDPRPSGRFRL